MRLSHQPFTGLVLINRADESDAPHFAAIAVFKAHRCGSLLPKELKQPSGTKDAGLCLVRGSLRIRSFVQGPKCPYDRVGMDKGAGKEFQQIRWTV